jgi:hypothetical protein
VWGAPLEEVKGSTLEALASRACKGFQRYKRYKRYKHYKASVRRSLVDSLALLIGKRAPCLRVVSAGVAVIMR